MHFFIEHTNLVAQNSTDLHFGPDSSTPTTKFNITTQFSLENEAKAFACQRGMMIVQRNDSDETNLVNLIIKPSQPTNINGVTVRYYVYRGIKLSSFFTNAGGTLYINADNPSTNNEFVTSFWRARQKVSNKTSLPDPTPLNLGYGHNTLSLTDPDNLNELRPIKDLFNNKAPAKSYPVEEGMWIGDFTNATSIAFEIELESELGLTSTLKTYRASVIWFPTDSLTGLALKRRKELISTFIDPAAFFGMHSDVGVNTTTYTGTTKNKPVNVTISGSLYTDIISKFANKNRVYLDIRSEKGLSYNSYDNYKISDTNLANIRLNGNSESNAAVYETNGWPVIFFDTITNYNTAKNKVSFRLRIDGNTEPVLFIENSKLSKPDKKDLINFYKGSNIKDGSSAWTKDISLYFSHAGSASSPANSNVANYLKVFYFLGSPITGEEADYDDNPRLINEKYYDSAFCSIDLEGLGDATIKDGHAENSSTIYIKEAPQIDDTGNFSFAAQSGAYWDTQRILFYSKALLKSSSSGKQYLNTYIRRLSLSNSKFSSGLKDNFYSVCKKYETGGGNYLKILGLNSYQIYSKKSVPGVLQEKEDLMLLGLTISEIQAIKNTSGLSSAHPRYIFLDRDHTGFLTDTSAQHHRYYRYIIKIQGLVEDSNGKGIPTVITPSFDSQPIKVYSRDNIFFSSTNFAASEALNAGIDFAGQNRIEFRIFRDGAIYINDNIDLSMLRKKIVSQVQQGTDLLYSLTDDNSVSGDISTAQTITYLYYDCDATGTIDPAVAPVSFCSLYIIMSDQRELTTMTTQETNARVVSNPPTNLNPVDIPGFGYEETFNFTGMNVDGVNAERSYISNNGDVLTLGHKDNGTKKNKKYRKISKKIFMIYVNEASVNASLLINNRFTWHETVRYFARPDLFAVYLAALRDIDDTIQCGGFAFPDASSFPSNLHVNGNAFDINYFQLTGLTNADDVAFIRAIHKYGTGLFRIGPSLVTLRTTLNNITPASDRPKWVDGGELHNNHLHTEGIKIHK